MQTSHLEPRQVGVFALQGLGRQKLLLWPASCRTTRFTVILTPVVGIIGVATLPVRFRCC